MEFCYLLDIEEIIISDYQRRKFQLRVIKTMGE